MSKMRSKKSFKSSFLKPLAKIKKIEKTMEAISNLIKLPELKKTSERAELIKFFVDNLRDIKGKPYRASRVAMKLSHLKENDLYYFISECKDRINRGKNWQKYFWGSLKTR